MSRQNSTLLINFGTVCQAFAVHHMHYTVHVNVYLVAVPLFQTANLLDQRIHTSQCHHLGYCQMMALTLLKLIYSRQCVNVTQRIVCKQLVL